MKEKHSKFVISASQRNLKLVSSESVHSSCLELPAKFHLFHLLRLVFSRALEELGIPIHYTSPMSYKSFSNCAVQDYCSSSRVAQVSSLPLSRRWVHIKKREEMALLSHK